MDTGDEETGVTATGDSDRDSESGSGVTANGDGATGVGLTGAGATDTGAGATGVGATDTGVGVGVGVGTASNPAIRASDGANTLFSAMPYRSPCRTNSNSSRTSSCSLGGDACRDGFGLNASLDTPEEN